MTALKQHTLPLTRLFWMAACKQHPRGKATCARRNRLLTAFNAAGFAFRRCATGNNDSARRRSDALSAPVTAAPLALLLSYCTAYLPLQFQQHRSCTLLPRTARRRSAIPVSEQTHGAWRGIQHTYRHLDYHLLR